MTWASYQIVAAGGSTEVLHQTVLLLRTFQDYYSIPQIKFSAMAVYAFQRQAWISHKYTQIFIIRVVPPALSSLYPWSREASTTLPAHQCFSGYRRIWVLWYLKWILSRIYRLVGGIQLHSFTLGWTMLLLFICCESLLESTIVLDPLK